jgi:hypothetical protein
MSAYDNGIFPNANISLKRVALTYSLAIDNYKLSVLNNQRPYQITNPSGTGTTPALNNDGVSSLVNPGIIVITPTGLSSFLSKVKYNPASTDSGWLDGYTSYSIPANKPPPTWFGIYLIGGGGQGGGGGAGNVASPGGGGGSGGGGGAGGVTTIRFIKWTGGAITFTLGAGGSGAGGGGSGGNDGASGASGGSSTLYQGGTTIATAPGGGGGGYGRKGAVGQGGGNGGDGGAHGTYSIGTGTTFDGTTGDGTGGNKGGKTDTIYSNTDTTNGVSGGKNYYWKGDGGNSGNGGGISGGGVYTFPSFSTGNAQAGSAGYAGANGSVWITVYYT